MMSKQVLFIFAALLLIALVACGSPATQATKVEPPTEAPATSEALSGELVLYSGQRRGTDPACY